MVKIRTDLEQNCIVVTLRYGDRATYLVDVRPDVMMARFTASNVRTLEGELVIDDIRYHLETQAVAEVYAWLKVKLNPPTHCKVVDMREQILRAFLVIMSRTEESALVRLRPFDESDVRLLKLAANKISTRITKLKKDAYWQHRMLSGAYLDDIKASVLADVMKEHLLSKERRDWYSRVLGLVFSWKGGHIPRRDHEEAERLMPGFRCLVGPD